MSGVNPGQAKKKVLIVDDSRSMGQFLTMILSRDPELCVVGHALDPYEARDMIKKLNPDVLTLDVEMPKMDGITFLRNLMRLRPMPVVMLSSLTAAGAEVTLDALAIGALDFAVKQQPTNEAEMSAYAADIVERVRNAARTNTRKPKPASASADHNVLVGRSLASPPASSKVHRLIALGASTGGPAAITDVFAKLDLQDSAMVLSQHMPAHFMDAFAQRLNAVGTARVVTAEDGQELQPGLVYIAPGDQHLLVRKHHTRLIACIDHGPKVQDHRPSVDVMFKSVAEAVGPSAVGVLLTGMGQDGAEGMVHMRRSGAVTIAQDEATSVVWGMPGSAVRLDGADAVEPLSAIPQMLNQLSRQPAVGRSVAQR